MLMRAARHADSAFSLRWFAAVAMMIFLLRALRATADFCCQRCQRRVDADYSDIFARVADVRCQPMRC